MICRYHSSPYHSKGRPLYCGQSIEQLLYGAEPAHRATGTVQAHRLRVPSGWYCHSIAYGENDIFIF